MGAKLAAPEKLCINVMGDSSFGMTGMDIETASRNGIGILTIVFNNSVMACERHVLETSTREIRRALGRRQLFQGRRRFERRLAPRGEAGRDRTVAQDRARYGRTRPALSARNHRQGRLRFLPLCRPVIPLARLRRVARFSSGIGARSASRARAAPAPFNGRASRSSPARAPAGTYDLLARLVARHMPKYLPGNPTAIVQNMPGGGNVVATNYMYNNALKDGTVIAVINDAIPLHQVIDGRGVRFDADKFNWLGSPGDRNSVTFAWHTSGIKTIEDVMQPRGPARRHGRWLEHRHLSDRDEQSARHEVQDRARLSQLVGGLPRDGARRDRGAQRRVSHRCSPNIPTG